MAELILRRYCYSPTATLGLLELPTGQVLFTVERPWIYNPVHGSEPFKSCVPDGVYNLKPHSSEKYPDTWALVNPDLKVHRYDTGNGRYACLIHAGNTPRDVVGCIAPGLKSSPDSFAVLDSQRAMKVLRTALVPGSYHKLIIVPETGTAKGDL